MKVDALRVACGLKLDHGVLAVGFCTESGTATERAYFVEQVDLPFYRH